MASGTRANLCPIAFRVQVDLLCVWPYKAGCLGTTSLSPYLLLRLYFRFNNMSEPEDLLHYLTRTGIHKDEPVDWDGKTLVFVHFLDLIVLMFAIATSLLTLSPMAQLTMTDGSQGPSTSSQVQCSYSAIPTGGKYWQRIRMSQSANVMRMCTFLAFG